MNEQMMVVKSVFKRYEENKDISKQNTLKENFKQIFVENYPDLLGEFENAIVILLNSPRKLIVQKQLAIILEKIRKTLDVKGSDDKNKLFLPLMEKCLENQKLEEKHLNGIFRLRSILWKSNAITTYEDQSSLENSHILESINVLYSILEESFPLSDEAKRTQESLIVQITELSQEAVRKNLSVGGFAFDDMKEEVDDFFNSREFAIPGATESLMNKYEKFTEAVRNALPGHFLDLTSLREVRAEYLEARLTANLLAIRNHAKKFAKDYSTEDKATQKITQDAEKVTEELSEVIYKLVDRKPCPPARKKTLVERAENKINEVSSKFASFNGWNVLKESFLSALYDFSSWTFGFKKAPDIKSEEIELMPLQKSHERVALKV